MLEYQKVRGGIKRDCLCGTTPRGGPSERPRKGRKEIPGKGFVKKEPGKIYLLVWISKRPQVGRTEESGTEKFEAKRSQVRLEKRRVKRCL